jgi:DDE superfamily endonuclease
MDIVACLPCLQATVPRTTLRQCRCIAMALLGMTGRVTMLGLSRWAGPGGSYRTVQRFVATVIPWATLLWVFFRHHISRSEDVYLLVGDAVIVTKAGKSTHGLARFFASLYGKPVPGLAFFTFALVSTQQRRSFPLRVEPVVRSDAEKAASQAQAASKQAQALGTPRRPGRPKGSKHKTNADGTRTPELVRITGGLAALLPLIAGVVSLTYVGLDGHFGNHNALQMARQQHLHLISKLRCEAARYFPYTGPYAGRGPHRKYGDKVDYDAIPLPSLKATTVEGQVKTCISQMQLLHKAFPQPLHVVIIVQTNLRTQARAHVVLFSSDLTLAYAPLIDSYGLRFHIEIV